MNRIHQMIVDGIGRYAPSRQRRQAAEAYARALKTPPSAEAAAYMGEALEPRRSTSLDAEEIELADAYRELAVQHGNALAVIREWQRDGEPNDYLTRVHRELRPPVSGTSEPFAAAREAIRQARGGEAAPQVPVTFGPCGDDYEATTGHAITRGAGFGAGCQCDDDVDDLAEARRREALDEADGHYGDNGNGISGQHTGRVEDCAGPGCGPRDCEASAVLTILGKPETFGPCALREGHDGPMHRESGGRSWAALRDGAVSVPRDALRGLVEVAEYVSNGSFYNAATDEPYPDATARRALGALDDAGLLDQFRNEET